MRPTFDIYDSEVDDVCIVHVCTEGMDEDRDGPIIRIYLNDEVIFENPSYPREVQQDEITKEDEQFIDDQEEEYGPDDYPSGVDWDTLTEKVTS